MSAQTMSGPAHRPRHVARIGWRLIRQDPIRFTVGTVLWVAWWAAPAVAGLLLASAFDAISDRAPARFDVPTLLVALAVVEGLRLVTFYNAFGLWGHWWASGQAVLRANLLAAQVSSGGDRAGPPVRAPGVAVAVFRDDVEDFVELTDGWVDLAGAAAFGIAATVFMLRVDVLLTLVVIVPVIATFVITRLLAERIRRFRRVEREATARVTGLLGGLLSGVLAVKVAGAEHRAVARLRRLNLVRRRAAVRDKALTAGVEALNSSTIDITIGLVLLLSAAQMRAGTFTVGDLALFVTYLAWLDGVPRYAGTVLTRHRHAQVAAKRMAALLPGDDERRAVADLRLADPRVARLPARDPRPRAPEIVMRGFGVRPGDNGVTGVDLRLAPGSFTVVVGAVGAGKSTLLQGLLGLAGPVEGEVRWDGDVVVDLAAHMVPPRCAFVPQVPTLVSGSLRDNLTLGRPTSSADLHAAVHAAAFDRDLEAMPRGLDTAIGARGVRLSGGQLQRAAIARALLAGASFLVFDDVSSALDAGTELRLWQRLLRRGPRPTVLVVSHRAAALAHADQVLVVDGGRVVASGSPAALRAAGVDLLAGLEAGPAVEERRIG